MVKVLSPALPEFSPNPFENQTQLPQLSPQCVCTGLLEAGGGQSPASFNDATPPASVTDQHAVPAENNFQLLKNPCNNSGKSIQWRWLRLELKIQREVRPATYSTCHQLWKVLKNTSNLHWSLLRAWQGAYCKLEDAQTCRQVTAHLKQMGRLLPNSPTLKNIITANKDEELNFLTNGFPFNFPVAPEISCLSTKGRKNGHKKVDFSQSYKAEYLQSLAKSRRRLQWWMSKFPILASLF